MVDNLQFFHLPPQGGAVNAELFSGFFELTGMFSQGFKDQFLFKVIHGVPASCLPFNGRSSPHQVYGETFGTDVSRFGENEGMLNDILEFTNISGVVVAWQDPHG